jgi:hypothetical protein
VVVARQTAGGTASMDVLVDGNVVDTFSPSAAGFAPRTINLSTPAAANVQHTLTIRPDATLPNGVDVDYTELHNTGSTQPVDTDGDTVNDDVDQCPAEPGQASNNGCPVDQPAADLPVKIQAENGTLSGGTVLNTGDSQDLAFDGHYKPCSNGSTSPNETTLSGVALRAGSTHTVLLWVLTTFSLRTTSSGIAGQTCRSAGRLVVMSSATIFSWTRRQRTSQVARPARTRMSLTRKKPFPRSKGGTASLSPKL